MNVRQARILEILQASPALATLELARALNVSDETIRRDLRYLASAGAVEKFHGGVRLSQPLSEAPFTQRLRTRSEAKTRIAAACDVLIPDGATLFLDNSSSACFLARRLARRKGLTVITVSLQAASLLAEGGDGNRIIVPGGELRASDMTITGAAAIQFVARFSPAYFVMSVAAVSATRGCLDFDLFEAELKRALMPQAECVVMLADAAKFSIGGLVRSCGMDEVDVLISDAEPPSEVVAAMAPGARVVVANGDHVEAIA